MNLEIKISNLDEHDYHAIREFIFQCKKRFLYKKSGWVSLYVDTDKRMRPSYVINGKRCVGTGKWIESDLNPKDSYVKESAKDGVFVDPDWSFTWGDS